VRDSRLIGRGLFDKSMRKTECNTPRLFRAAPRACLLVLTIMTCLAGNALTEARAGKSAKNVVNLVGGRQLKSAPNGEQSALELSLEQAMWTALAFEDADKLRELLKRGADPNKPEQLSQMTPLMAAETAELVKILLQAGADPNQRDRIGRTALHHAVKMREAGSIVRLLGKAGADVNARAKDIGECTPLLTAVEHYFEDKDREETAVAIRILIHLGADVDAADSSGRTALARAAEANQADLVRLLIELGADPKRRLVDGKTPLDYARDANAKEAIQALAAVASKQPPAN